MRTKEWKCKFTHFSQRRQTNQNIAGVYLTRCAGRKRKSPGRDHHRPPSPRIVDGTKTKRLHAERIGVEALGLRRESKGTRRQIKVIPISAQA